MKKMTFISTIMMTVAMCFAAESSMRPESSIPTPAEKQEISRNSPDLGAKESEDWQRMRAERRRAREQILSDLRNRNAAEKQNIRQDIPKKREEYTRREGDLPKNQPRERHPFYERPESQPMMPSRDMPGPAIEEDHHRR